MHTYTDKGKYYILAMSNQETLQAVVRGYRMEKPNYPGQTTPENLNAIYKVSYGQLLFLLA